MRRTSFLLVILSFMTQTACHQSLPAKKMGSGSPLQPQVSYTAVVKSELDLPQCDTSTEGMKAYVKTSDSFAKCSGFSWLTSSPGSLEGKFEKRTPIRYYEWTDAKENRRWSASVKEEIHQEKLEGSLCQKGFVLPTEEDLKAASMNGLFEGVKAHGGIAFDKAWTANKSAVSGISRRESERALGKDIKDVKAGVYCVSPA